MENPKPLRLRAKVASVVLGSGVLVICAMFINMWFLLPAVALFITGARFLERESLPLAVSLSAATTWSLLALEFIGLENSWLIGIMGFVILIGTWGLVTTIISHK